MGRARQPLLGARPPGDPRWDPLGFPVLGAVAGTVGCLAALEAVKVLTGWENPSSAGSSS